ncbi:Retrovirus-related Pol polyprotein from transposon 17.6 [Labeo rohita]|uniref:ribonuclease H n=1 Tax=Labeo rohita TaxID=84645 RepID=A0ABQ8MYY7_LABRO|nr:Retrovirus-related Pol polyprotein from transposon 17.6 [Labeo rohita]
MKEEIEYMLCYDIAIPSQSPWSSPCLLVPKPDSSFRFCTDYRKRVLVGVINCEVYMDDVVVYSSSWEEHVKALEDVFSKLAAASLTLNAAKSEFGKAVVTYLGKQVDQGCVRPVVAKVEAILQFPTPSNKHELRRFLGMAGYYRGFCRNFSAVVSPLTDLLSSSRKFIWDSSCSLAFDAVKDLLCNAPVLSAPNFEKPFKLQVDASATGLGAVLLQEDEHDVDHPISYFSKKFMSYQRCYSTIEKEALALLLVFQHFNVYVGGSATPLFVYTDHNPLTFLAQMSNANQRLMRWLLIIQEYNLEVRHLRGSENVIADALSRANGAKT